MGSSSTALPDSAPDFNRDWTLAQRIGFRFIFCYFSLYLVLCWLIERLGMAGDLGVAGANFILRIYSRLWAPVVSWTGSQLLHVSGPIGFESGGNSDGIYSYLQLLCFGLLACAAALAWTLADRRKTDYRRLHSWLMVCLRYALAFSMLEYGAVKVVDIQFHRNLRYLSTTYGNLGPYDVLLGFMSYSRPYTFFTGAAEILAGALLVFRRTATLGGLVALVVLSNVVMLNLCYNWPEKLDSTHLLAMAAILIAPDLSRLANLLVWNRPTLAADLGHPAAGAAKAARLVAKSLALVSMIAIVSATTVAMRREWFVRPPLYGIYQVEEFRRNGQPALPLATDSTQWKTMVVQFPESISLKYMDDRWQHHRAAYDPKKGELAVFAGKVSNVLSCQQPDPEHLVLQGPFLKEELAVRLKRLDEAQFPLMKSRFRWINGFP
jgi:uncharacterized membrane protein YphA (DoxX/SURF4 family)